MSLALFPYQREGADWLSPRSSGYLADEMRLGKTPQAIEAVNLQFTDARVTVICPAYLRINWGREAARWAWWPWKPTILSYEAATKHGLPESDVFIFDEAHYLKSPSAQRTQALLGLANNALAADHPLRRAAHVWPLSGTPGNPGEMWTWLRAMGATTMDHYDWCERYCNLRWTQYGFQVMGLKRSMLPELREVMGPWFLRRTASQVGLPVARWGELSLDCGVDNKDMAARRYVDPDGDELPEPDEPLATLVRELGERKVAPLVEAISHELDSGELNKVVIFAWHHNVLRGLEEGLKRFNPVRLDGSMTERQKQAAVDRFREDPTARPFIGQIEAAGVGWDLSAASDAVFCELSWNPDDNAQAAARILGPLQTRPCLVRVAASEDPLDYALGRVNARKSSTIKTTWS